MRNRRAALALAGLLWLDARRETRRRNYEEWRDRMESNIRRWESSLDKLEYARDRCCDNLSRNEERLSKQEDFYERITTGKSRDWYERTLSIIANTSNVKKKEVLQAKIDEYEDMRSSVESQIGRLESWIENDRDNIRSIDKKISDVEDKISDVRRKL